jgi:putative transposase
MPSWRLGRESATRGRGGEALVDARLGSWSSASRQFVSKPLFSRTCAAWLRAIFAKVCTDFEAQVVEMEGEDDHVHLLVEYPPKVAVSDLVNSVKGVSSRLLRKERPDIQKRYWKSALWSPSYFASSCGGASISIVRQYIEQQKRPL